MWVLAVFLGFMTCIQAHTKEEVVEMEMEMEGGGGEGVKGFIFKTILSYRISCTFLFLVELGLALHRWKYWPIVYWRIILFMERNITELSTDLFVIIALNSD